MLMLKVKLKSDCPRFSSVPSQAEYALLVSNELKPSPYLQEPIKRLPWVFLRCNEAECSCYSHSSIACGINFHIHRNIGHEQQSKSINIKEYIKNCLSLRGGNETACSMIVHPKLQYAGAAWDPYYKKTKPALLK